MTDEIFNQILQIGSYNGKSCYNNYEEMEQDYKTLNFVSLTPLEVKRLIFTAYIMGKGNDRETD